MLHVDMERDKIRTYVIEGSVLDENESLARSIAVDVLKLIDRVAGPCRDVVSAF
jgi:hypothetical protein